MRYMSRCLLTALLLVGASLPAEATVYSSLYVFGDSLVDSGNAAEASHGFYANPIDGYYAGRFSNGPNFADDLAGGIGVPVATDALHGGTNFAVGGATAFSSGASTDFSFDKQVASVIPLHASLIPNDALVLVTFGGNDVRATLGIPGAIDFSASASDFANGLAGLYALGARNFVIVGSPDIGLLPVSVADVGAGTATLQELTDRSKQISSLFLDDARALDALAGTQVTFFDLFSYEHKLLADPAAFGLPATLDSTTPCQIIGGGYPQIDNCVNSLYFDDIHPTQQIHQAIATAILATAPLPEPTSWVMMIVGFGFTGSALRRVRRVPALA